MNLFCYYCYYCYSLHFDFETNLNITDRWFLYFATSIYNYKDTGTVSGITKNMVGLGSVDNTLDISKPVSTAQQAALDLKAPIDSPTFTGTVVIPSNKP